MTSTAGPASAAAPAARSRRRLAWVIIVGAGLLTVAPTVLLRFYRLPGASMLPTIGPRSHVIATRFLWLGSPRRGDIVVFDYPERPSERFIKRVVAVGGDTVLLRGDSFLVNGIPIARQDLGLASHQELDPDRGQPTSRQAHTFRETLDGKSWSIYLSPEAPPNRCDSGFLRHGCGAPYAVPAGEFFVLGDNRDNSHDSRFFGAVPLLNVRGRVLGVVGGQ
jgi:signal peptidase I